MVLLRVRCTPTRQTRYSPHEIPFRKPPPLTTQIKGNTEVKTFMYQTHYSCEGTPLGTCVYNQTTYCDLGDNQPYVCCDPEILPGTWYKLRDKSGKGTLYNYIWVPFSH
ncbi:Endogenous retrovirus group 3 member 1 Env polyprotein [Plecturocebus cupreus]